VELIGEVEVELRASSPSQQNTLIAIEYSSRNSTAAIMS
jgi:hypothetical protein